MNYITLTFNDKHYEQQYVEEQFEVDKAILKKLVLTIIFVALAASINNYTIGNPVVGTLMAGVVGCIVFTYLLCCRSLRGVDLFIFILQLIIHSIMPITFILDITPGSTQGGVVYDQYAQGLMFAYFSFMAQIGSKYYLKAFPYFYSLLIQIIAMEVRNQPFTFPFQVFFILSTIASVTHIYYSELGRRRNFIKMKQNSLCNRNVFSNYGSPYLTCYLDEFSLKLLHINPRAEQQFNIHDQIQFLISMRTTFLNSGFKEGVQMSLEKFIYLFIKSPEEANQFIPVKEVTLAYGEINRQRFRYHISKYLDEYKQQVVVISVKRAHEIPPLPIEEVHALVMKRLQTSTIMNLEPILQPGQPLHLIQNRIQQLQLDLYNCFLYSNYSIKEEIVQINLLSTIKQSIGNSIEILKTRGLSIKLNIHQRILNIKSKPKLIQLLFGNLMQFCISKVCNHGLIYIKIDNRESNTMDCMISYSCLQIDPVASFELNLCGYIIAQLGPLASLLHEQQNEFNCISFQLYQLALSDKLSAIRKVTQYNFAHTKQLEQINL